MCVCVCVCVCVYFGLCVCGIAALLSLSERCPALSHLNISGIKKVCMSSLLPRCCACCGLLLTTCRMFRCVASQISDVGVRYLSQGCHRLQFLDATGVFLLTDGKTRDFGLEGLQVCVCVTVLSFIPSTGVAPAPLPSSVNCGLPHSRRSRAHARVPPSPSSTSSHVHTLAHIHAASRAAV